VLGKGGKSGWDKVAGGGRSWGKPRAETRIEKDWDRKTRRNFGGGRTHKKN